ncbi:uncharacterized protein LOC131605228 [Vicia villosa]|uniref:uncharacterized protein LOC131605228 n=1 Tax=Vicia villosa TaxID=3911 RepID=UPI00273C2F83|nr:uncharacterized protein LOC131605228 [Vicia villosa]
MTKKKRRNNAKKISDIFYRYPIINGARDSVTYNNAKIEDDEDVTSMLNCHTRFSGGHPLELYVCFHEEEEVYPTQSSQIHQYQQKVVDDDSDSDDARQLDLFGGSSDDSGDVIIPLSQPSPVLNLYNQPYHTRNHVSFDSTVPVFDSIDGGHDCGGLEEGMKFENKESCMYAIRQYHIKNNVDYEIYKSDTQRFLVRCRIEGCGFTCRASLRKGCGKWVIRRIGGLHTCMASAMSQDHIKLDSNLIAQSIRALVSDDASIKVKTIIAHVRTTFNYTISYKKGWLANNKAIESIYRNWEASYNDLPQWLLVMREHLPGTVIELETLPAYLDDGTQISGARIFHRLFWAFQPSTRGFAYCKPIVQVDGTWLYGKYRGTMLMAVAQDENVNIFPIAYALVEGETGGAWSFFLKNLRLHVTPQSDICLISDRHESIKSAYNNPDNGWKNPPSVHVYCIRHIAQNFMRAIKDKDLRKKVVNMGYALTESTYAYYRVEIRQTGMEAFNWIENLPREKWSRAYDGGRRWGHMTTNLVESLNSVMKETRNLPITALVRSTYFRMGTLFWRRGHNWTKMLSSKKDFTDNCMKEMQKEVEKSHSYNVLSFDRERNYFVVQETVNNNECRTLTYYNVDLQKQTRDCGKFQTFHVPCSHAIAACSHVRLNYQMFIPPIFRVQNIFKVYEQSFIGVPKEDQWTPYQGDILLHNERMRRNKKGRPNSTRIRTEMDTVEKVKRRCGICQGLHMRKKCLHRPNAAGPSN